MKAIFPGTFAPPTLGHLDILQRAAMLCDQLIVAIGESNSKLPTLPSVEQRAEMLQRLTTHLPNVTIGRFTGLAVDYAAECEADVLVRGVRTVADLETELPMAQTNRHISGIETLLLAAEPATSHIRSSLVREIASKGGRLHDLVPKVIEPLVFAALAEG